MPTLPAPSSPVLPRVEATLFDDFGDGALGFEAACPALQLADWESVVQAPAAPDAPLN